MKSLYDRIVKTINSALAQYFSKQVQSAGIVAFGVQYQSYKALAENFNQDPHLIRCRINRYGWSTEKAVLTPKHGAMKKDILATLFCYYTLRYLGVGMLR